MSSKRVGRRLGQGHVARNRGQGTKETTSLHNAHNVQITGGSFNVIGGNVNNNYGERKIDIWEVLKSVPNFRKVHQDTIARATEGTCLWLLETEEFLIWVDAKGYIKILWGSGIAGAGKTIAASTVIARLETLARGDRQICVAFVYIRYSDDAEATVRTMLEIFVKQIVERHNELLSLVEHAYAEHLREDTKPTEEQLLGLLAVFADRKTIYCVLDALDEVLPRVQLDIMRKLSSLDIRLFITSRPLKAIETRFPEARILTIAAKDHDLDLHIAKTIQQSVELQDLLGEPGTAFRNEVVSLIKEKCGGMFLHASLQLDALSQCASVFAVKKTLATFPPRIEEVYLQTWERVLGQSADHVLLAKTILLWVLNAERSMTIDQLRYAVATCPETYHFEEDRLVPEATLIGFCHGLLIVEEETRLVRLVHYTAKETLTRLLHETFPYPHSVLASTCMTYLTDCGFQSTGIDSAMGLAALLDAAPFLAYAHAAWAFHVRNSLDIKATVDHLTNFVTRCKAFPVMISMIPKFDLLGPLHIIALYDLPLSVAATSDLCNPNTLSAGRGDSPLLLAAHYRYNAKVQALLSLPGILVDARNKTGLSPFMEASRIGNAGAAKLLLTHPDVNINGIDANGWSALALASVNGQEDIVKLLLSHPDIEVNSVPNGRSAFILACRKGYEGIVRGFLAHPETQVNLADPNGWCALIHASLAGHEDIVKLLLSHPNILVELATKDGHSALAMACAKGHTGVVKLLLTHPDVKVNCAFNNERSGLILACARGHEDVVKVLLAHPDTKVGGTLNDGWSALMLVSRRGYEGIVRLLLAHPDTKPNSVSHQGWSALHLAAQTGHKGVVRLLLAHRHTVTVNLATANGATALLLAAQARQVHIVELLLAEPEIEVNAVDENGNTALKVAAEQGYREIVNMLLQVSGIDVTIADSRTGHTALSAAFANAHIGVVHLIRDFHLRNGIPVSIDAAPQ